MDLSQIFVHPAILVAIASGLIAFTVWLVRLEGKGNEMREKLKEIEIDLKDTRTRFFEHTSNAAVHHNAQAYLEFKNALERRLLGIEGGLKDIGVKLDRNYPK